MVSAKGIFLAKGANSKIFYGYIIVAASLFILVIHAREIGGIFFLASCSVSADKKELGSGPRYNFRR